MILFKNATNRQIQICAKRSGLDEIGYDDVIHAEVLSKNNRTRIINQLTKMGFVGMRKDSLTPVRNQ